MARITTTKLRTMKANGDKITMLTAYDYAMAKLIDQAGVECILVGDSLGMVVLGYDSTLPVTMEDMLHHTKAVVRGTSNSMVVADMPFLSYHLTVADSVKNAGRFLQEAGAHAVKLEGGKEITDTVRAITNAGIPVVGHIGLTPQQVHQLGGFTVQGKDIEGARKLIEDAKALEEAGAFAVVLECVPAALAKLITEQVNIPTIGIGAGPDCDGQVLVNNDMLGIFSDFVPKFVKQYANLKETIDNGIKEYIKEVKDGTFPEAKHCFGAKDMDLSKLY